MQMVKSGVVGALDLVEQGICYVAGKTVDYAEKARDKAGLLAVALFGLVLAIADQAKAEVTLPTMPVDFDGYATAGLTVVGTVFGAIATVVVIVALTRMGLRKLSAAFSGRA